MGSRSFSLAFAATVAFSATAWGQTQIKPRVLIMVDTSGSMTLHLDSNVLDSGGDGSFYYEDAVLTRGNINGPAVQYSLNPGFSTAGQCTANPTFDTNSRMASAKQAVTNVVNGSGDIDWALMRYAGTYCAFDNTTISDPATRPRMQPLSWPNANYQAGSTAARTLPSFVCTSSNQCQGGAICNLSVGRCRCTGAGQCPGTTACDLQTGVCECDATNANECPNSLTCDTATGYCKCTAGSHCTSGSCADADVGQCTCDGNADCPSGSCNTTTGMCNCTSFGDCSSESCEGGTCRCGPGTFGCRSGSCDTNTGICGCTAGNQCESNTCTTGRCRCSSAAHCLSGTCTGGFCTCSNDHQCMANEFCIGGVCQLEFNTCILGSAGSTSTRNNTTCQPQLDLPGTYAGECGTREAAGTANCATRQTCYANSDCTSNVCDRSFSGTGAKWGYCTCGACPSGYTCAGGFCTYNRQCVSNGGVVVVDPANTGGTSDDVLLWADGKDIYKAGGNVNTASRINPELRALGLTPLAGAARAATDWYKGITTGPAGEDPKKACRPYVLVQLTDGFDTCEGPDSTLDPLPAEFSEGPVAAAQSFVGATITDAKVPNKVYVIGLAFGGATTTVLDDIAKAGGTTKARLANTQQEIEAALADIVASSILVEKCNNADDDCNDKCDEPFPGVQVNGAGCTNPHSAAPCDNGLLGHCNAPGTFVCSADQLSQVCQTRACTSGTANLSKSGNTITLTATAGTFTSADNGKIVTVTSAGANKGNFTLTFVDATHVTYTNSGGATQTGVSWNIYCVNSEDSSGCNGFDDNCDGLKDNCSSKLRSQPVIETLKQVLRDKHLLLILDNFEHLLPAATQVSELLAAAPDLKVLATSREPLHLYGEQEYAVPPLALPDLTQLDPQILADCESIALFMQGARAVRSGYELTAENAADVAQICVRLDGLPLAIELAAARIKLLTPPALLSRLMSRLDTLTSGAQDVPVRQRTLRSTIEWSYNLLDDGEKILFARLAIFRGGCSLDAIETVCIPDLPVDVFDALESLVNKSLIQQQESLVGEPRFVMLETIHEYAWEQLRASGEVATMQRRHAEYFTQVAEFAQPQLRQGGFSYWMSYLENEDNNLLAALDWSLEADVELGLRLVISLRDFWIMSCRFIQAQSWTQRALAQSSDVSPHLRVGLLTARGIILYYSSPDRALQKQVLGEAVALARAVDDKANLAWALIFLAGAFVGEPAEYEEALSMNEEGLTLFRDLGYKPGVAQALNSQGELMRIHGDDDGAQAAYEECLLMVRETGEMRREAMAYNNLGCVMLHRGNAKQAVPLFRKALVKRLKVGHDKRGAITNMLFLAGAIAETGDPERAARLFGGAAALLEPMGVGLELADQPEHERHLAFVRSQLDTSTFEACWNAGRAMSFEQMVASALEGDDL